MALLADFTPSAYDSLVYTPPILLEHSFGVCHVE